MEGLNEENEGTIREFLKLCLKDGVYVFEIDGKSYLLEDQTDIDEITTAIKNATPPIIRYRIEQAQREITELRSKYAMAV